MRVLNLSCMSVICCIAGLCFLLSGCTTAPDVGRTKIHEGGVVSAHPLATRAGLEVLQEGGNAFDAAITVAAVLAVVEPFGSGLGGGGFWLLHDAAQGRSTFIDGREMAPMQSHSDMYIDSHGNVDRAKALFHPMAAGIPGTPAAIMHLHENFASLPLHRLFAPAIALARNGFPVSQRYIDAVRFQYDRLGAWPESGVFLDNGQVPELGWVLKQPALAGTLEAMVTRGRSGFYSGDVANRMVEFVQSHGGVWTKTDLANYRVVEREPIIFSYGDFKITTSPLPSSGGLVLASILGQLEAMNFDQQSALSQKHILIEAMRRAYFDRSVYMGDSDFTDDSGLWLITPSRLKVLAGSISDQASVSDGLNYDDFSGKGEQTTHYSIIDQFGNRVAATLSINLYFGTGIVAGSTGVLLNNEMDDFSAMSGVGNAYGLVGRSANKIAPRKRPLSSMTPTFVESASDAYVLGTPGGSRIISMVALGVLSLAEGADAFTVVAAPRYHHQYLPDEVQFEPGALTLSEQRALAQKGHKLREMSRRYGDMQLLHLKLPDGVMGGASDPRGEGEFKKH